MKLKSPIALSPVVTEVGIIGPALASLYGASPTWLAIITLIFALYHGAQEAFRERLDDFAKFVLEHPGEFREEIISSQEFKDAMPIYIGDFLKCRSETKRNILKRIILGFATSQEKERFELERLDNITNLISVQALEFLGFLGTTILPDIKAEVDEQLKKDEYVMSDRSIEWWEENIMISKSIWVPIDQWLNDKYSPNSLSVKDEFKIPRSEGWPPDLQSRAFNREKHERNKISEAITELVSLGVFRLKVTGGTIGGASDYGLTIFGIKFLKFLS